MNVWRGTLTMLGLLALGAAFVISPGSAEAATFTVEDGAAVGDNDPGDGECKSKLRPGTLLRNCTFMAAVEEANALSGSHTIILPSGTFRFDSLHLGDGGLNVTGRMTVIGAGASATELKSAGLFNVGIKVPVGARLELRNLTFRDSVSLFNDGGELIVSNSVVRDNRGRGAIVHQPPSGSEGVDALTTIINSRVTSNKPSLGQPAVVGGVFLVRGNLRIENSTIDANEGPNDGIGGIAILNGVADLRNVTISGNTAGGAGGVLVQDGRAEMRNVTVANNSPVGIRRNDGGSGRFVLQHTILAGNGIANCFGIGLGTINDPDFIMESGSTCNLDALGLGAHPFSNADPKLGPLQGNGGPTPTHALLAGSPAIDVASTCLLLTDQRGRARPRDGDLNGSSLCDLGAFEVVPPIGFGLPLLGVPGLSPGAASVQPGDTLKETLTWDVPAPQNWGALGTLDLRLRSNGDIVFWVRWDQLLDTFQLMDAGGNPVGFPVPPGARVPLSANGISLDVAAAETRGSGITGQRATLVLPLRFDPVTAGGVFSVEVSAQDDEGRQDPFAKLGTITVLSGASASDNDKREREKEKPLTELGRLKKARSNDGGFDDEQIEGNVLAVRCDVSEIDLGSKDGVVTLKLRGAVRGVCASVRVGNYIQVDGQKENEFFYWVDDLDISS